MTLIGENEETKKIVLRMITGLLSVLEDSCEDTGHLWCVDRRINDRNSTYENPMDNGTKLQRI